MGPITERCYESGVTGASRRGHHGHEGGRGTCCVRHVAGLLEGPGKQ